MFSLSDSISFLLFLSCERTDALEMWCWRRLSRALGQQGQQTCQSHRRSVLNIHWRDWCWSSNTLATWCKEPTQWKRPWCWGRLRAGGEGGDRGWDGWMASLTQRTWVFVNSGRWGRTGKPGVLQSAGSQRVGHDLPTEQQWGLGYEKRDRFGGRRPLVQF